MSSRNGVIAGLVLVVIAAIFYTATDRNAGSSVGFAVILFAGFGFIARAVLQR